MGTLLSTALAVGVIAAVSTWFYLIVGSILIWAGFIAWACFFALGGNNDALTKTIICNIFGVVVSGIAAILILAIPLAESITLPAWAGLVVGVTVIVAIMASSLPYLSAVPAIIFGYAANFAYLLQTFGALSLDSLLSLSMGNGIIVVSISMVLGALFGYGSAKFIDVLAK